MERQKLAEVMVVSFVRIKASISVRSSDMRFELFLKSFLIDQKLQSKSMDWFLYDKGLRHERVKETAT